MIVSTVGGVSAVHDDVRALARQLQGDRAADAGGRACHERRAVLRVERVRDHHRRLLSKMNRQVCLFGRLGYRQTCL